MQEEDQSNTGERRECAKTLDRLDIDVKSQSSELKRQDAVITDLVSMVGSIRDDIEEMSKSYTVMSRKVSEVEIDFKILRNTVENEITETQKLASSVSSKIDSHIEQQNKMERAIMWRINGVLVTVVFSGLMYFGKLGLDQIIGIK